MELFVTHSFFIRLLSPQPYFYEVHPCYGIHGYRWSVHSDFYITHPCEWLFHTVSYQWLMGTGMFFGCWLLKISLDKWPGSRSRRLILFSWKVYKTYPSSFQFPLPSLTWVLFFSHMAYCFCLLNWPWTSLVFHPQVRRTFLKLLYNYVAPLSKS